MNSSHNRIPFYWKINFDILFFSTPMTLKKPIEIFRLKFLWIYHLQMCETCATYFVLLD
jgi:hypothetical protein